MFAGFLSFLVLSLKLIVIYAKFYSVGGRVEDASCGCEATHVVMLTDLCSRVSNDWWC